MLFLKKMLVKLGVSKSVNIVFLLLFRHQRQWNSWSLWYKTTTTAKYQNKTNQKTVLNRFIMFRNVIGLQLWLAVPWILTRRLDLDSFILQHWVLDIYLPMSFSAVWTKSNILIGFPKRINIILQNRYMHKQFTWCKL